MVSPMLFRRETSEVSRNAGCFLRIEDSLRSRRDRSRETGKFWKRSCEDLGKSRENGGFPAKSLTRAKIIPPATQAS